MCMIDKNGQMKWEYCALIVVGAIVLNAVAVGAYFAVAGFEDQNCKHVGLVYLVLTLGGLMWLLASMWMAFRGRVGP